MAEWPKHWIANPESRGFESHSVLQLKGVFMNQSFYICGVCEYQYDEADTGMTWEQLPKYWNCPECGSAKEEFALIETKDA